MPLLFITLLFMACEDTETNSPALQGEVNNSFFKASDARGVQNEDGSFTLQGINEDQILTLHINGPQLGRYSLGQGQTNFATYEDADGNLYSTSPDGHGSIELTQGCDSCGSLTGNFSFVAIRSGIDTLTVNKGFFFDVSYLQGGLIDPSGQVNAGTLEASVDDLDFIAVTIESEVIDGSIVITGAIDESFITIKIPVDAISSSHPLPEAGYVANYTVDGVTEEAESGLISVNYNNGDVTLVFFQFNTANHSITAGRTRVSY